MKLEQISTEKCVAKVFANNPLTFVGSLLDIGSMLTHLSSSCLYLSIILCFSSTILCIYCPHWALLASWPRHSTVSLLATCEFPGDFPSGNVQRLKKLITFGELLDSVPETLLKSLNLKLGLPGKLDTRSE